MSFYYLTPVKGEMPAHLMETIVIQRLEFLKALLKGDSSTYNEFLVDGSVYDNVGHFMLCVISILSDNTEIAQFVLKAELELFKRRLVCLGAYELRCFAKKLIRSLKKQENFPFYLEPLHLLCQHMMLKDSAHHICSHHKNDCTAYKIKLNFRHCLSYVAKREVELQNGTVYLPCAKWKQYLVLLYGNNLRKRLESTDLATLKSDPRIIELLHKVSREFPQSNKSSTIILSKEVDDRTKFFPPCMLNLHRSLRKNHRLSHYQRFYYSLFLKDIGMPVEEAVCFWKTEYRQPSGSHSCCHDWERDEKKYLYGIRHMYGLEGGRKNYTSLNCQRIQSIDNACSEGGCPFKSFDEPKMLELLQNPSQLLVSQINENRSRGEYTNSCLLYLNSFIDNRTCDSYSFSFTPVKYYSIAYKIDL